MHSELLTIKQLLQDLSAATVFLCVTKSVQLDQISDLEEERENDI